MPVGTLSGGNQQKVVIAKWLMNAPRIMLLNDPTRGIDVGTKQEMYALLRKLADEGAAILLYSTDYAELIGCCDRVAVFFDGRIVRWLAGAELTEQALVASALNLRRRRRLPDGWRAMTVGTSILREHRGTLRRPRPCSSLIFALYIANHPLGLDAAGADHRRQQGRAAGHRRHGADPAGADSRARPLGRHGVRAGQLPCLAPGGRHAACRPAFGVVVVCWRSARCAASSTASIIVYGRLQPIITTLATGTIYFGLALGLRPVPGGDVHADLADALTGALPGGIPAMLVVLLAVVLLVWVPFGAR